jgi:hypothetical protein
MTFDRLLPSPPPHIRDGSSTSRRRRTADDFLSFCTIVLDYENYEKSREEVGQCASYMLEKETDCTVRSFLAGPSATAA